MLPFTSARTFHKELLDAVIPVVTGIISRDLNVSIDSVGADMKERETFTRADFFVKESKRKFFSFSKEQKKSCIGIGVEVAGATSIEISVRSTDAISVEGLATILDALQDELGAAIADDAVRIIEILWSRGKDGGSIDMKKPSY